MGKTKNKKQYSEKKKRDSGKHPLGFGFFIIPLIILLFAFAIILSVFEDGVYIPNDDVDVYISPVLKTYDPVEKTDAKEMENYFVDEAGLFDDETRYYLVNDSAMYFYEKTGVRPFIYTMSPSEDDEGNILYPTDDEANEICKGVCNELSPEGINYVILFMPATDGYRMWTYVTDDVYDAFGNKLEHIFEQYTYHYFNVVGYHDDLFYSTYRATADRLMSGPISPITLIKENLKISLLTCITLATVLISVAIYVSVGKKAGKRRNLFFWER